MKNFFRYFENSKYEQIGSAMLVDCSVTVWNVRVFKGTHLTVELSQQSSLKHRVQFRVFIEVLHEDPCQTLRVHHKTELNSDRVEVIEMDKLKELGFVTEADVLTMRIGIKPADVVLQLQAVALNLIELKKEQLVLTENCMKLNKKLNETYEVLTCRIVKLANVASISGKNSPSVTFESRWRSSSFCTRTKIAARSPCARRK